MSNWGDDNRGDDNRGDDNPGDDSPLGEEDEEGLDPVAGAPGLQWSRDLTAETPALPDLPDAPPPDEREGAASATAPTWDRNDLAPGSHADEPPIAPGTSVFVPEAAAATQQPGTATPPGPPPPAPPPLPPETLQPRQPNRPPVLNVVLGLAALGGLLVLGLAVLAVQGDDEGPDGDEDTADGSTAVVDDLEDDATLIVGSTGVVGTWSGSEWVPRADGDQPGAGVELDLIGPGEVSGTAVGEAGDPVADSCTSSGDQDVQAPVAASGPDAPPLLAVAGVDDPLPRPVEHFQHSDTYQDAAADLAEAEGMAGPATVSQVLRMDLDGTGTDEVVVAAGHISDPENLTPSPEDWSMVFLRRVVGSDVETDILASSQAGGANTLEHIQVSAVADLNDDGDMEVVLSGRSASSDWVAIHATGEGGVAGGLSEVLRTACGE